jgi:ABC-type Zn uptake system ZnuABC Zn-binding protein ZnuA
VIDLGHQPPSNAYLTPEQLALPEITYPLQVFLCTSCWLVQLPTHAAAEELFTADYAYFSSTSSSWCAHAERFVDAAVKRLALGPQSLVVELASNDGYLLQYVQQRGIPCLGIEPTAATAQAARAKGITTLERFFGVALAAELEPADLVVANNVLAHVPDINDFVAGIARLLKPEEFEGQYDPHVWFDVALWSQCADVVAETLGTARPASKDAFQARAVLLKGRLEELDRWVRSRVSEVPAERRILVTSHDAFNYFGRAYGFKVVALQGVSTVTEAGLADVTQLVDFIRSQKVPAVFVETSVPHATIERISKDAGVKMGGELFSDALGTPGEMEDGDDLGTYEGMIRHNIRRIVGGLK